MYDLYNKKQVFLTLWLQKTSIEGCGIWFRYKLHIQLLLLLVLMLFYLSSNNSKFAIDYSLSYVFKMKKNEKFIIPKDAGKFELDFSSKSGLKIKVVWK